MSQPALGQVAPELVNAVRAADNNRRRRATLAACELAVDLNDLRHQTVVVDALRALAEGASGNTSEHAAVNQLVERLDETAWSIQERVEANQVAQEEYLTAFKQARAVAAVAFAFASNSETAALEAMYEAYHATQDVSRLWDQVREYLM
jgi:hypothetical protein